MARWQIPRGFGRISCWSAAAACLLLASPVRAQTPSPLQEWQYPGGIVLRKLFEPKVPAWQVVLGAGAALKPIYDGSATYRVQAGPSIDIRYRDIAFASTGEGIGVNLLRGRNYRAGLALAYDLGRRVSQDPSRLHGLGNIEPAPVAKLFLSYAVSRRFPLVLRADLRRVLGGADGWIGDLGAYMPLPGSSRRLVMFAGPSVTLAAGDYMNRVFGVGLAQATRSGYPRYNAHGGLEAVGIGFSATWFATRHWLLNVDAAVSRLMGSAAGSPIVQHRLQNVAAASVSYKW